MSMLYELLMLCFNNINFIHVGRIRSSHFNVAAYKKSYL